jgi:hypothetical protein
MAMSTRRLQELEIMFSNVSTWGELNDVCDKLSRDEVQELTNALSCVNMVFGLTMRDECVLDKLTLMA